MIVCVCKRVNSAQIKELVAEGATGVEEVSERLGLGTGCGRCVEYAEKLVDQELKSLFYEVA